MITHILVLFTYFAAYGAEPPTIVESYLSADDCRIALSTYKFDYKDELNKSQAIPVCMGIQYET